MTLALISIVFFSLRFIWLIMGSAQLQKKWVKIVPHVVDTCLLVIGVTMMIQLSMTPMNQPWLAEKLFALFAYIFTGYYALKLAKNRPMQIIGYLGAVGWFMLIVRLAMSKQAMFIG